MASDASLKIYSLMKKQVRQSSSANVKDASEDKEKIALWTFSLMYTWFIGIEEHFRDIGDHISARVDNTTNQARPSTQLNIYMW